MVSLPVIWCIEKVFELNLAGKHHAGEIAAMSRDYIENGLGWSWTADRVTANIDGPEDIVLAGDSHRPFSSLCDHALRHGRSTT